MKQCIKCGAMIQEDYQFCTHCGARQTTDNLQRENVCVRCGNSIQPGEKFCSVCGYCMEKPGESATAYGQFSMKTQKPKYRLVAGLLGILVGCFGIHRLYLGDKTIAIVQLIVTIITCGVGGLWGVIEGLLLLYGKMDKDAYGNPLEDL